MESVVMTGRVVDSAGRPIVAGARVSLECDGVSAASTLTRTDGGYRFPALRPRAVYRARAEARDRRSVEYDDLYLEASRTHVVDFRLKSPGERLSNQSTIRSTRSFGRTIRSPRARGRSF